jgi:hypothetical protein
MYALGLLPFPLLIGVALVNQFTPGDIFGLSARILTGAVAIGAFIAGFFIAHGLFLILFVRFAHFNKRNDNANKAQNDGQHSHKAEKCEKRIYAGDKSRKHGKITPLYSGT